MIFKSQLQSYQIRLGQIFLLTVAAAILSRAVFAQTTPGGTTPTPLPTVSEDDVRQSLQDRLKRAAEEKTGEAKKILGATDRAAVVGILKDIANDTLTIAPKSGTTKMIATTDQTAIVRKGKTVAASDLSIGDFVIAMGYSGGNDTLDARRVVAVEKAPERLKRQVALGIVSEIDRPSRSFTLTVKRPVELGNLVYQISVPKSISLDFAEFNDGSKLLVVGTPDAKNPQKLSLRLFKQF